MVPSTPGAFGSAVLANIPGESDWAVRKPESGLAFSLPGVVKTTGAVFGKWDCALVGGCPEARGLIGAATVLRSGGPSAACLSCGITAATPRGDFSSPVEPPPSIAGLAEAIKRYLTSSGVSVGSASSIRATTPLTTAVACEVPDIMK